MDQPGTLIFTCGKMGAGKTTLCREIARELDAMLLSEDEWLAALYPDEIKNFDSYLIYSSRLKSVLKSHVQNILRSGVTVVMDFPGNTVKQRQWFKDIFAEYDIPHELIYLEVSDALCLKQIGQRRITQPERRNFDTEDVFHEVSSYFQPPSDEESFNIRVITREAE